MNRNRIIIFGTGNGGSNAARHLSRTMQIVGFLDNNAARQGKRFKGKPVYAPSALADLTWDEVHIASNSYYRDMADQLASLGVPENKIRAVPTDILQAERSGCCSLFCVVYYGAWLAVVGGAGWGVFRLVF